MSGAEFNGAGYASVNVYDKTMVIIREIKEKESKQLADLLNEDHLLRSYLGFLPDLIITATEVQSKIEEWTKSKSAMCFGIMEEDIIRGMISLSHIKLEKGTGQIGYWMGSDHRNKGICSQAFELVIQKAHELGLHTVSSTISVENRPSRAIWEKHDARVIPISSEKLRYELK